MHCHSKPEHPLSGLITHAECIHRDRNFIILTHIALFNNGKWADCQGSLSANADKFSALRT